MELYWGLIMLLTGAGMIFYGIRLHLKECNQCAHQSTTELFRSYSDLYVHERCNHCGKELYTDL